MASSKLKIIVLIPVFEGEIGQRSCVGKLQVSKVPVQNLSVS